MGQDLCNLTPGNAVVFCCRQVIPKRGVRQSLRHQCYHRHKAAVPEGEFILSAPHLPEQYLIVKFCKFWCKFAQSITPCGLFYCHYTFLPIS